MTAPSICLILPCYRDLPYVRPCLESFFANTDNPVAVVSDDGTPDLDVDAWMKAVTGWREPPHRGPIHASRFLENSGGPTRGWNEGLAKARALRCDYAVCGNSDTLFTPGWEAGILDVLRGFHLAGPVTNAPGWGSGGLQDVRAYLPGYEPSDEPAALVEAAERLWEAHRGEVVPVATPIVQASPEPGVTATVPDMLNGFTMVARTETWWEGAFDRHHVFNPAMARDGQELELQLRWAVSCRRIAVAPSSFVFHYRSVARGDEYLCKGAYRKEIEQCH